jgi:small subunit ribosomal protein S20
MPHHKSAVKRMRTSKRDRDRNVAIRSEIKSLLKKMTEEPGNREVMNTTMSELDRAVRKGVLKKAIANRRKSRLARAANRSSAGPAKPATSKKS